MNRQLGLYQSSTTLASCQVVALAWKYEAIHLTVVLSAESILLRNQGKQYPKSEADRLDNRQSSLLKTRMAQSRGWQTIHHYRYPESYLAASSCARRHCRRQTTCR